MAEYEDKVLELYLKNKAGIAPARYPAVQAMPVDSVLHQIVSNVVMPENTHNLETRALPKLALYQICDSEAAQSNMPAQFLALQNVDNHRADWREYWPIRQFLLHHTLDDDTFYGFFSPGFTSRTGLDFEKIRHFVHRHGRENDVLIFSPFWDLNSFFINSFVQGDFFHPGLMQIMQNFSDLAGLNLNLGQMVMHTENTAYCNYFIAKKKFWLHWLELGEKLYQYAESDSAGLPQSLKSNAPSTLEQVPAKILVQERLVNMLLAQSNFKSKAFNVFDMPASVMPLNNFMSQAVEANALKFASANLGEQHYADVYHAKRQMVWEESGMAKWEEK